MTLVVFIALALPAGAEVIQNPSFELESDGILPNGYDTSGNSDWGLPDLWTWRDVGLCNGHGIRGYQANPTDGQWCLYMFTMTQRTHQPGDFLEWYQDVDLTDVEQILFDVRLYNHNQTRAYFAVDGESLWTGHEDGLHIGESVPVSQYTGVHQIAVGIVVLAQFEGVRGSTYWDNLRTITIVATEASSWSRVKSLFE